MARTPQLAMLIGRRTSVYIGHFTEALTAHRLTARMNVQGWDLMEGIKW